MPNFRSLFIFLLLGLILPITNIHAAQGNVVADQQETVKAKVLEILSQGKKDIPGTDTQSDFQKIEVQILEGTQKGQIVDIDNDFLNLNVGQVFYLTHTTDSISKFDYYSVSEPYRLPQVAIIIAIFVLVVIIFGGIQGIRGLLSLIGGFLLILYVLLPGILHGYSPILMTTAVSALIIIVGSYITHGFNKTTSAAVVGMIITVFITGLFGYWAVHATQLSGFNTEEASYLNLDTHGSINMLGVLFGGIMIGLLGVLYDIAIGQAVSVEELLRAGPHLPKQMIYKRAIRIGREHIGALVNTLAIAYVGVSLPLLLLFYTANTSNVMAIINREIFSAEIVRIMIGSIGLVIAVPITTGISVWMLLKKDSTKASAETLASERHALEHAGHKH
jgi:uncharacterized membrane protein